MSGSMSWSMALQVGRVATAEDEAIWLEKAAACTVAEMRRLVRAQLGADTDDDPDSDDHASGALEERCTLTITANIEDVWLYQFVCLLVQHMVGGSTCDVMDALLGETQTALFERYNEAVDLKDLVPSNAAQEAWHRQLAQWREEGERLCEHRVPRWEEGEAGLNDAIPLEFEGSAEAIDAALRQISAALQEREVRIGELAEAFWRADGWRQLGYATDAQYARERLGMGVTSVYDKRLLVRRLGRLPALSKALREHRIGYEAARAVAAVATEETDAAWTERAMERTLVHLDEDIEVAEHLSRVGHCESIKPPSPDLVTKWRALKGRMITGAVFSETEPEPRSAAGTTPPDDGMGAIQATMVHALKTPPELRSKGRETLRLRVTPEIRAAYRGLERYYLRKRRTSMTFLHFACGAFIEEWGGSRPQVAYGHIYERDGLRCTSPVCRRRDLTPHHIKFRSRGGGDEPGNLTSECVWCHLGGVHCGLLDVKGEAPMLEWHIAGHTRVQGRTRTRVSTPN